MTETNENKNTDEMPFVSVIMPVFNEADFIERSVTALLGQTYPPQRMEIIIADGMSTDNTRAIIEQIKTNSAVPLIIVENPQRIAPTALNSGIKKAKGEIIIRVDGHTIIEPDYIGQCVAALQRTDACNVGGRMSAFSDKEFGNVVALATSSQFGIGNSRFHYSDREEFVDSVYLGAWRKQIFEKYGFFNEELVRNQDDEFNYRLRANGCNILLCPLIKSRYYNRTSIKSLWRQYYQYGFWKVRVLQLHPRQMSLRQFVPFIFVLLLTMMALLSTFSGLGRWGLLLIAGSYLGANLTTSLILSIKTNFKYLPFLSLSFMILHLSYGLGFLAGLISFRHYWRKARTNDLTITKL